jgi:lipoprotein-anchoring transpeptidase ErfK/SrfK
MSSRAGMRASILAVLTTLSFVGSAWAGDTEASLRKRIAWQAALDRVGFSPGLVDGRLGPKTTIATQEFQRVHGLPVTGQLDEATARELGVEPETVFGKYTLTAADLDEVGPVPKSWVEKSKLHRLGHEALENVLAEKFHCSTGLLATLNPGKNINSLQPGGQVVVPSIAEVSSPPKAARIEINLGQKIIRVVDRDNKLVALFHCSIAKDKEKRPSGEAHVTGVAFDPNYTFKPEMWPDVKEHITSPLTIPPGPRNPVGRCWVSLSLPGYGMHGTPNPELIGKTGSHGCFRLANWDAQRLGKMVQPGTPVRFTTDSEARLVSMQK